MADGFQIGSAYVEVLLKGDRAKSDATRLGVDITRRLPDRNMKVGLNGAGAIAGLGAITAAAGVAGAALAAIPALGASVAGIGGVLAGAFSGVGAALKGYQTDQKAASATGGASAAAASAQARQIRDAQQSIDDARRNAVKVARDSTEKINEARDDERRVAEQVRDDINDAREDERQVAEDTAEAIADARDRQADVAESGAEKIVAAGRKVADALDDERDAHDDLSEAIADHAVAMDELREKVSDYALTEEDAAIRVERSKEKLTKVMADEESSALDLREARNDLAQAEERLLDLQRDRAKSTADLAEAERLGVNGSEKVITAQEKLEDAQRKVADAQTAATKTAREVAKANVEAADKVAEAVSDGARKQAEAAEKVADAVADGAERQQEAAAATTRAQRDGAEAQEAAARAVAEAIEGLADAQASANEATAGGAAATSEYADAMAKLLPSQRALVLQLIAMGPLVDGLKRAGSDSFLPGLTQMLKDSAGLFPIFEGHLRRTGTIMGETALKFGEMFKSPEFKANLDALFKSSDPITRAIGDGLVSMTSKLVEFGANMAPASAGFAQFLDDFFTGFTDMLTALEPYAEDFQVIWESLGRIVKVLLPGLGVAIGRIAEVLAPVLDYIADWMEKNPDKIDDVILGLAGLFVVLKAAGLVKTVTGWTSGVIGQWDKLPPAAAKAAKGIGKAFAVLGLIGAADTLLPEADPKKLEQDPFASFDSYSNHQREDLSGMWDAILDPSSALADAEKEFSEFPARFDQSPFMNFFRDQLPEMWRNTWEGEGSLGATFSGWGERLSTDAGKVVSNVTGWFSGLGTSAGEWFGGMKDTALLKMDEFKTWAGTKATEIRDNVSRFLSELPGKVGGWFTGMKDTALLKLTEFRDWASTKATEIRDRVSRFLSELPGRVAGWFTDMKDRALAKLTEFRDWAGTKATELRDRVSRFLSELPGKVSGWFTDMKDRALRLLDDLRNWAGTKAGEVRDRVMGAINNLPNLVRDAFQRARDWAGQKLDELVNFVRGLPGKVMSALGSLGTLLGNSGRSLVDGFLNGIKGAWNGLVSWVRSGMTRLRNLWPFSPAKDGPFSGKGYVTYSGAALTSDFAESLRKGMPGVIASARAVMDGAHGELSAAPIRGVHEQQGSFTGAAAGGVTAAGGVAAAESSSAAARGRNYGDVHIHMEQTSGSPAETGRFVALALRTVG